MLPNSLIAILNFRKEHGAKNSNQTPSDLYISATKFRFEYIHNNFICVEEEPGSKPRGNPQDFGSDSYQFF